MQFGRREHEPNRDLRRLDRHARRVDARHRASIASSSSASCPATDSKRSTANCRRPRYTSATSRASGVGRRSARFRTSACATPSSTWSVYQGDTEFASNEQQRFLRQQRAQRVRSRLARAHHGGGDAPRLSDVPLHGRALRQRREDRGAEDARAPRLRQEEPAAQRVQRRRDALARFLRLHQLHGSRRQVSAHDALALELRAAGGARWGRCSREEAFHMGTGITGLAPHRQGRRHSGRDPAEVLQQVDFGSLDLFGTDHSGSAQWAYTWGIKGRVDEDKTGRTCR